MKKLISLLLALAMLASLAACGSDPAANPPENPGSVNSSDPAQPDSPAAPVSAGGPVYGGSATYYVQDMKNYFAPEMDELHTYAMWFESLWAIDWSINDPSVAAFDSNYVTYKQMAGQIADTWQWDEDAMTLTVTLRDDVTFQVLDPRYDYYGGRNVTADDVKYSYDRLAGLGSGWSEPVTCDTDWASRLYMLDSVESDGALTVTFHMNTGSEVALNNFMTYTVNIAGPEWDALTEDQQLDWHYACGTGPYILSDYIADTYLTYTRNENYYDCDERYPENRLPYMDTVTLQYIPDSTNLASQFVAGAIDYIGWNNNLLNDSEVEIIRSSMSPDSYSIVVSYNAAQGIGLRMDTAPFDDLRVRKALQMAINIDEINDVLYGYDTPAVIAGLWDVTTEWSAIDQWDAGLAAEYSYDPEGAKALLAEAGYPDGFTFNCELGPMANTDLYALVGEYFNAIGVTMVLDTYPDVITLNGVIRDPANRDTFFQGAGNFSSLNIPTMVLKPENGFYYENDEFLGLMDQLSQADTLDSLNELANRMDLIYAREHWIVALGGTTQIKSFVSSHIGGYTGEKLRANANMRTVTARLWSVDGQ